MFTLSQQVCLCLCLDVGRSTRGRVWGKDPRSYW